MPNMVGFKGFTKPAPISPGLVTAKLSRMSVDGLFVWYTGGAYRSRKGSGRSGALTTITEVKKLIPITTLIERAAKAHGDAGYSPDTVRSGLFLHGGSKPAVYLALQRDKDGNMVAARDYPFPDGFDHPLKSGDIVIPAGETQAVIAAPKRQLRKGKAQAQIAAPKK